MNYHNKYIPWNIYLLSDLQIHMSSFCTEKLCVYVGWIASNKLDISTMAEILYLEITDTSRQSNALHSGYIIFIKILKIR